MPRNRILVLLGSNLTHLNTLATLLDHDVNVVGVCVANKKSMGINFQYLKIAIKKHGLFKVILQIIERVTFKVLNSSKDKKIFHQLFNETNIHARIKNHENLFQYTEDYQTDDTLEWMKSLKPDIILIHTPYWVGKKVRNIPSTKMVIGGHEGITPYYRGVHSAFWAIYQNKMEDVGVSVFFVDKGVDTGDVIVQKQIKPEKGDSYITLSWKGMKEIAKLQAKVLRDYDHGIEVPRHKHESIPENSNYTHPTIFQYIRYRRMQDLVR